MTTTENTPAGQRRELTVAFDIGGTFTDVIFVTHDGRVFTRKLLSQLGTIGSRISEIASEIDGEAYRSFTHATTTCSNALLENKVASTGMLTTKGFRDVLEMRSQRRPSVHDVGWERTSPLIPRRLVHELSERVLADGAVEVPVDDDEIRALLKGPLADVEAIAICLINSPANPEHERRIAALIEGERPEMRVSVSAVEFPELGEYERMSTTAVNASLMPVVNRYLTRLEGQIDASGAALRIMQSQGGLMDSRVARTQPVQMIESGPAAGVLAAARVAANSDLGRVLAFDMGGTTAKASAILDACPLERPQVEVGAGASLASRFFGGAGHLVRTPSVDLVEVGAGGGSIAWIDSAGALRVGPEGAGAEPGPACYGNGGTRPTVTDANVVLGYLSADAIADGSVPMNRELAEQAIGSIANPLGLSVTEAAHGIVQIANTTMIRALRAVSVEKGQDPREFTMVAYGGAGPVHAVQLAEDLGVSTVYIPPFPGIFSAVGLMLGEYRHDAVVSLAAPVDSLEPAMFEKSFVKLQKRLSETLVAEGVDLEDATFHRQVDLKYRDTEEHLSVPCPPLDDRLSAMLTERFSDTHLAKFHYVPDAPLDVVGLRMRATAAVGRQGSEILDSQYESTSALKGKRASARAYFGQEQGFVDVDVLTRKDLDAVPRSGPLLLNEPDTTIVVLPAWSARVDKHGNIILKRENS
ncbi:hydantoinase/oxoprolinase family protein [Saccharopolyspora karakumensis]|uniref:Hydantoinase/oxoprolinase family protein n=1 Tax=Saccharopolyspora karakumensis TaxID=2530386 RepID=A0A4R5B5E0_9PSEU|nr:hydantoinase/oxoprolinase family protein [Saccharopolyspora karakumensis]TDD81438.1 hydantoinase/oxoprolinase family protein [Saccharopolyspora karakumensis]